MSEILFPRTEVAGVSLSRMIIGTNWMLGWSHRGPASDHQILNKFSNGEKAYPLLKTFLDRGVDTMMGPLQQEKVMQEAVKYAQEKSGKKLILIDTPIINVDDNEAARREARATIRRSRDCGATFCLVHHSSAEQLVNKNKHIIDRLPDYLDMIRQEGMIPGLSAHMPELVTYSDENEYDVQTYIQIYNAMGFLMQVEIETVNQIIHNAKKPVMTIKPMAAGRTTPFVGLNFVWNTIRPCDLVTVGCFDPEEAEEDIEISLAAIERRCPNIEKRSSPNVNQDAFGNK
ncbi:MAG: hypothetical protein J6M20_00835 [Clostridia bacterium]|nr:hypothetical protein [Clostridia bacterium]MBQ7846508.1 hypothetical protein [Clostridia bacterium]